MRIFPATVAHLVALQSKWPAFGEMVGSSVPEGWPEFPESIAATIDRLRQHPDEADWWMHFFVEGDALVGSGGFLGPPTDGLVEINYEIAPAFRERGLARSAAEALIEKARTAGNATTVLARTRPQHSPSTGVLRRLGFRFGGELTDPRGGTIWSWRLPVAADDRATRRQTGPRLGAQSPGTVSRAPVELRNARDVPYLGCPDRRLRAWKALPFRTFRRAAGVPPKS